LYQKLKEKIALHRSISSSDKQKQKLILFFLLFFPYQENEREKVERSKKEYFWHFNLVNQVIVTIVNHAI